MHNKNDSIHQNQHFRHVWTYQHNESQIKVLWSFNTARRPPLVAMEIQAGGLLRNE